ncbi:MAG TPA: tetratricopeptide repeat protein [Candidatus Angelobacter sp.]
MKKLFWVVLWWVTSMAASQSGSIADLTKKAEGGEAEAQFQLGRAYDEGDGTQQDPELAAKWYRKSAEQGNAFAQNNLGVLYSQGLGVPHDKQEAARWFTRAAQQCHPNAAYNIAIAYYNGDGVVTDPGLAFAWLVVAKQCGNSTVQEAMDRISAEMKIKQRETGESKFIDYVLATPEFKPDVDRLFKQLTTFDPPMLSNICQAYAKDGARWFDQAKATFWCQQAVDQEYFDAYEVLGRLAEKRGDFKEAFRLYREGVDRSPYLPVDRLGTFLLEGKGVQQDAAGAYFWFYIAVKEEGDKSLQPKLDLAKKRISGKERKKQEKLAAEWVAERSKKLAETH